MCISLYANFISITRENIGDKRKEERRERKEEGREQT